MEVISKELHKNLLPIILVLIALFAVVAMLSTTSGIVLAKGLVTQVMYVEAGKNGLAHISTEEQTANLGQIGQTAGSVSNLSIILESASKQSD